MQRVALESQLPGDPPDQAVDPLDVLGATVLLIFRKLKAMGA